MTNLDHSGSTKTFEKTVGLKAAMDDAVEGYEKMLEKAEPSFKPTVSDLLSQHRAASREIDVMLLDRGAAVDEDGSFMGAVHKTVVMLRSVVDDVDDGWIPGILDGEKRNLDRYDEAIAETTADSAMQGTLRTHRESLQRWVDALRNPPPAQRATG